MSLIRMSIKDSWAPSLVLVVLIDRLITHISTDFTLGEDGKDSGHDKAKNNNTVQSGRKRTRFASTNCLLHPFCAELVTAAQPRIASTHCSTLSIWTYCLHPCDHFAPLSYTHLLLVRSQITYSLAAAHCLLTLRRFWDRLTHCSSLRISLLWWIIVHRTVTWR